MQERSVKKHEWLFAKNVMFSVSLRLAASVPRPGEGFFWRQHSTLPQAGERSVAEILTVSEYHDANCYAKKRSP
jgi:hypothetical protein